MALRNLPDGKRLGDSLRALEDIQRRADALLAGNQNGKTAADSDSGPDEALEQTPVPDDSGTVSNLAGRPLLEVDFQTTTTPPPEKSSAEPGAIGEAKAPVRDPFMASLEALRRTLRHEGTRVHKTAPAVNGSFTEVSAPEITMAREAPVEPAPTEAAPATPEASASGPSSIQVEEPSFSALENVPLPEIERAPTPLPQREEPKPTAREKRRQTPAPQANGASEQSLDDALDAVRASVGLPKPEGGQPQPSTPRPRKRRPLSDGIPKSVSEDLPKFRGKPRMRICNRCGHETKLRDPECRNCGKVDESLGILDAVISGDLAKVEQILLVRPHLIAVQTNRHAWTLLHMSASGGNPKMAELLISKGAAVNATNRDGKTPLHYAAGKGHLNVVETLLAHFADVDAKYNGKTAADLAHEHSQFEVEAYLRDLKRAESK